MKNVNADLNEFDKLYNVNMFSIFDLQHIINESDGDKYDIIVKALKVGYVRGHNDGYIRATREAQA